MRTSQAKGFQTGLSAIDRLRMWLEREGNKRLRSLGTALYRLTRGRITPRHRHVVLLTTRGRKSGREHTVLLQAFPDGPAGESLVLVAANSGKPTQPDWFHNLQADPTARVEIMGRTVPMRAAQVSGDEAAALWPRILRHAPTYVLYRKATDRVIPLVRLVPVGRAQEPR
jgi:deazaflavin-dependent oxidoreductase (nitroreductase family)